MDIVSADESLKDAVFCPQIWSEPDLFLMADERLIDEANGATFHICPVQKHETPVLEPTERWEGGDGKNVRPFQQDPVDGTILYDAYNHRFHAWYRSHNRLIRGSADPALGRDFKKAKRTGTASQVCYAASEDGINWHKLPVRRVPFEGSLENNMIPINVGPVLSDHLSGVIPNYLQNGGRKLVATVYSAFEDEVYDRGITQLYSDNGLDWEPHWPPTIPLDGDAHSLAWNPREQCYVCTTRSEAYRHILARLREQGYTVPKTKRHIALAKSKDLTHWTPMAPVLEVDEQDGESAQMYHMYILPYGHLYLGFVQLFYVGHNMTYGPLEMQLAVSRDMENWYRPGDRTPILPRGEKGTWDEAHVSIYTSPPHLQGNQLRFWYGGKDTEHWQSGHAGMGTGTLRRDGFACWEAGPEGGTITSIPMRMAWATWPMLNVDATNGECRMEILGEDGNPIEGCSADDCLPITGDHIRAMVEFKEGRGTFVRHSGLVRLRFHLKNAKLYAVKATNTWWNE